MSSLPLSVSCGLLTKRVNKVSFNNRRLCVYVADQDNSEALTECVVVLVGTEAARRSLSPCFSPLCLAEQIGSRYVELHEVPDVDQDAVQLRRIKNVDYLSTLCLLKQSKIVNLRNKGQLGWQKLSNCHELKHTLGVIELDGVVGELAGDVALPVEDAHCHHRPHQH